MSTTPDAPNGDGYAYNFDKRLDKMKDIIVTMIDLVHVQHKAFMEELQQNRSDARQLHLDIMAEMRELLELQREHRIDIMALFQVGKEHRGRIEKLEEGT